MAVGWQRRETHPDAVYQLSRLWLARLPNGWRIQMIIELTAERRRELEEVNRRINAELRPVTDQDQYGVPEYWEEAERDADCDGYALRKRRELRILGWPKESLDIAVCQVETGEWHAVLIAHTDKGDFVLDNRQKRVLLWNAIPGYKFDRISVGGSFKEWRKVAA